ncbi:MAG: hypothetical protein ACM3TN_25570 [Alphaproteobacteria bacterium]
MTPRRKIIQAIKGQLFALLTFLVLFLLTNSGCSVYMAAKQPGEKDPTVLRPGTDRSYVIAELGAPTWSGEKNGEKTDIFIFKQG